MTIGLIILGVLGVLVFFGATERFFRKMGIANWLAFILVLAFVAGAVVPRVTIGSAFAMNIGGFAVPLVLTVALAVFIGWNAELFRAGLATLAVASTAVATRMLLLPTSTALMITASLIVGFVGGAVAFIIGRTRAATLTAALGGIVLGDVITSVVYRYFVDGSAVALGTRGVFDSLVIAAVFGVLLSEVIASIRKNADVPVLVPALEAGEDTDLTGIVPQEKIAESEAATEAAKDEALEAQRAAVEAHERPSQQPSELAEDVWVEGAALLGSSFMSGNGMGGAYSNTGAGYPLGYVPFHFNEEDPEFFDGDDRSEP